MPASVLVVEDDTLIASSLARALAANGYTARTAGSVAAAIAAIDDAVPDAVLLDLGLPDGEGDAVAEVLVRRHPRVPIVVLTARSSELDVVAGLGTGAVDYVVKPFRLGELLARLASHLRFAAAHRGAGGSGDGGGANRQTLAIGDLTIDRAARRVLLAGAELQLRPKEFDLLERLARDAGAVVHRERLIDDVWDENWWGSTKTLDVHVNSLRRKLGELPGEPSRIVTVRGVGYRLDPAPIRP